MATNAQNVVGVVSATQGEVFARGADGKTRRLAIGDKVYEGDVIVTAAGSSADITPIDGPVLQIAEQQTVAIDTLVLGVEDASAHSLSPLGSTLAETVLQGGVLPGSGLDVNALVEADSTAAGLDGGNADEGGTSFVNLLRIVENVPAAAYDFPVNPPGEPLQIAGGAAAPTTPSNKPEAGDTKVAVDEDSLKGGIDGGIDDIGLNVDRIASGTLAYSFGPDGPASSGALVWTGLSGSLSSHGHALSTDISADGLTLAAFYLDGESRVTVFQATIDDVATGKFTVILSRPVDHAPGQNENDLVLNLGFQVKDATGDPANGNVLVTIDDDTPVYGSSESEGAPPAGTITLAVEEDSVLGKPGNDEADGLAASASGNVIGDSNIAWGADGFGALTAVSVASAAYAISAGGSVTVYFDADGQVVNGAAASAANLVVRSDGTYTFTVTGAMNNTGANADTFHLPVISVTAEDYDHDPINITLKVNIQDDVPVEITSELVSVREAGLLAGRGAGESAGSASGVAGTEQGGTIADNLGWGADGFGKVSGISWNEGGASHSMSIAAGEHSLTVYLDASGAVLSDATGAAASLVVRDDGTYTLKVIDNLLVTGAGLSRDFSFVAEDGDGDAASVPLNITIVDDAPTTIAGETATVYEAGLAARSGEPAGSNPSLSVKYGGTVEDNAGWGADGFGQVTGVSWTGGSSTIASGEQSTTIYFDASGAVQTSPIGAAANLIVYANGSYALTLTDNLLVSGSELTKQLTIQAEDADGDKANIDLTVKVVNDKPAVDVTRAETYTLTITNEDQASSARMHSSFGYYFMENGKPVSGVVVWDNVQGASMPTSVTLVGVTENEIGFFIIPDGDNLNSSLTAGAAVTFRPDGDGWQAVLESTGQPLIGEDAKVLFDRAEFNADRQHHAEDNSTSGKLNWEDRVPTNPLYDGDYNDVNIDVQSSYLPFLKTENEDVDSTSGRADQTSASFASLFSTTYLPGADGLSGAGTPSYKLRVVTATDSGLVVGSGEHIFLYQEGDFVTGRVGSGSGDLVFRIGVDSTGTVTLTQMIDIGFTGSETKALALEAVKLSCTVVVTDSDGDPASDTHTIDIGSAFHFSEAVSVAAVAGGEQTTNDFIVGSADNDILTGGDGNDLLYARAGNDVIHGGAGNDTLIGGAGSDLLYGGAGADVFKWALSDAGTTASPAIDLVKDFGTGDTLSIGDLLSNPGTVLDVRVGAADTTIHITNAATHVDQTILLENYHDASADLIKAGLENSAKFSAG